MKASAVLVEDHPLVRTGLRGVLEGLGIDVVAEAEDGTTAVPIVLQNKPDIAIVDLGLPGLNGIVVTRALKRAGNVRVLILTMNEEEEQIVGALWAGADGYCVKSSGTGVFEDAVRTVVAGGAFFDPRIAHVVLRAFKTGMRATNQRNPLTARELEILALIADGAGNAEIAERLCISIATVKSHVVEILRKLSASDRAHAAAIALRAGFL